jgi:hypothetical protein
MILKRDAATMDHIHVCDVSAVPCDDPEDQMVVAIGSADGRCTTENFGSTVSEISNLIAEKATVGENVLYTVSHPSRSLDPTTESRDFHLRNRSFPSSPIAYFLLYTILHYNIRSPFSVTCFASAGVTSTPISRSIS